MQIQTKQKAASLAVQDSGFFLKFGWNFFTSSWFPLFNHHHVRKHTL